MSRLAAVQAAGDALNELGVDQREPIDPFAAIERLGLVLSFKPLDDLLGVILPGDPGGVLINSARPAPLQRYTAAHELGHWYLDQDALRLDTEATVVGKQNDNRELDAQTFAAHFLMPLELIYMTAHRYGLRRGVDAEPADVYQVARDMHVSYEAAVRQLTNSKLITVANRSALLRVRPASIKRALADGLALPDPRGDVWLVDEPEDAIALEVSVGDAIVVRLEECPSTGYRWTDESRDEVGSVHQLRPAPAPFSGDTAFGNAKDATVADIIPLRTADESSDVLTLLGDTGEDRRPDSGVVLVGSRTTRLVKYGASAPGLEHIHLRHVRPFAPEAALAAINVAAVVRGAPEIEHRRRFLETFAREEAEFGERRG